MIGVLDVRKAKQFLKQHNAPLQAIWRVDRWARDCNLACLGGRKTMQVYNQSYIQTIQIPKTIREVLGMICIEYKMEISDEEIEEWFFEQEQKQNKKIQREKIKRDVPLNLRFEILSRDNFKCQGCGRSHSDNVTLEVDHKKPISKGGDNSSDNLWTLCFECNRGKYTTELEPLT